MITYKGLPTAIFSGLILTIVSFVSYVAVPEQNCFTDVTGTHCEQSTAQSGSFIVGILSGGGSLILAAYYGIALMIGKARERAQG